jgi:AcrR family transcriptional regulator
VAGAMISRREENAEATKIAIVHAARALFASDGYHSTKIGSIAKKARCTSGALYHHFGGKKEVFRSVVDLVMSDLMSAAGDALAGETDPWLALKAAIDAVLDRARTVDVRIAFVEAPTVLGLEGWREIEKTYSTSMLQVVLQALIDNGTIVPRPIDVLAAVLRGALNEAAMVVAEAPESDEVRRQTGELLDALLEGLRRPA